MIKTGIIAAAHNVGFLWMKFFVRVVLPDREYRRSCKILNKT